MIYLSYRLEKAGITTLTKIAVRDTHEIWVWEQLRDELRLLYPNVHIDLIGDKSILNGSWDLLVVPYQKQRGIREVWNDWQEAKKLSANWIMLYGLDKRQINIISTSSLRQLFVERIDYHWLERHKQLLFKSKFFSINLIMLLKGKYFLNKS